jgi:hypothetical protein
MKRIFAVLCAVPLLWLTGCADPPQQPDQSPPPAEEQPSSVWFDSEDGALSLRLGAPDTTVNSGAPITVVAELRNNTDEPVNVLRPFGDWYESVAVGIALIGSDGPLRYTGDVPGYTLGRDAFTTLEPGQSIYDWLDLTVDCFGGSDLSGQYTIRYTYAASKGHRESADRMELKDLWTGNITSRAVTVTKEKLPAGNKIEDVVSIQFPREEFVFTLAEVAKGVRFEYRIVVRRDLDGVIPKAQDTGGAAGPGTSGLYPFEKISGNGQSYSLRDLGLGWDDDRPRLIGQGTHVLSFDWDGKNWGGPSDTDNPRGPPFPAGEYILDVRLAGQVQMPDGRRPYDISRSASIRLVP